MGDGIMSEYTVCARQAPQDAYCITCLVAFGKYALGCTVRLVEVGSDACLGCETRTTSIFCELCGEEQVDKDLNEDLLCDLCEEDIQRLGA
jgi:hypothetical protein